MKSLILAIAIVVASVSFSVNATNLNDQPEGVKTANIEQLTKVLNLSPTQINQVYDANEEYATNMEASKTDRQYMKSTLSNLKQMKEVLTETQYMQYVALVNLTANNRSLMDSYDDTEFASHDVIYMANANNKIEKPNVSNIESLSMALNLTPAQINEVSDINDAYSLNLAGSTTDNQVRKALFSNLKQMKQTLTPDQYLKYVAMVNLTQSNRNASGSQDYLATK